MTKHGLLGVIAATLTMAGLLASSAARYEVAYSPSPRRRGRGAIELAMSKDMKKN